LYIIDAVEAHQCAEPRKAANKFYNKFPKNVIFPKGFLFNYGKKVVYNLKSWGSQKNCKTSSGSYSGIGLPYLFKKQI
jgi:hypothetical protein